VNEPASGTVAASRASVVRLMVPSDANFSGNVFGGEILSEVDRVAYITACRHAASPCVTASFDRVDFLEPVRVGEVVECAAELTYVGHSSMEVAVRVHARPVASGPSRPVAQAFVTMVAVDAAGRPVAVPPLTLTSEEERRRYSEGRARMELRRSSRSGR
jgi:acyl-CoA hydrolase